MAVVLAVAAAFACPSSHAYAAEVKNGASEIQSEEAELGLFSDGTELTGMNDFANALAKKTGEQVNKYVEEREDARRIIQERQEKMAVEAAKEVQAQSEAAIKALEETQRAAELEKKRKEEEARLEAERKEEEQRMAARQEIVDFALQFEGNPYVYGGTSLTNGADCSGFVMSVFQNFGYSLPRVAAAQCDASVKKAASELEPGDLVFYGSPVYHVALYIGDGKVIHASTAATGIKISNYDYQAPSAIGTYLK